jgi:type II secretory ATPase GspE/PulE/Tfp pilus assembly ATPase PilB-like protein
MDMIGENPLLASSVRLIMAQRLLRRLCPDCKVNAVPTKEELLEIKTALHDMPEASQPKYDEIKLFHPKGCEKCHNFGYRGRVGLFEQLEVTPAMEVLISQGNAGATAPAIEALAIKEGMVTLLQDGVIKALAGDTSLEEVYQAVGQ